MLIACYFLTTIYSQNKFLNIYISYGGSCNLSSERYISSLFPFYIRYFVQQIFLCFETSFKSLNFYWNLGNDFYLLTWTHLDLWRQKKKKNSDENRLGMSTFLPSHESRLWINYHCSWAASGYDSAFWHNAIIGKGWNDISSESQNLSETYDLQIMWQISVIRNRATFRSHIKPTYINMYKQRDSSWMRIHSLLGCLHFGVYTCTRCLISTIAIKSNTRKL